MALHPCPSCARHVRQTEARCPFCDAVQPTHEESVVTTSARLGRAAIFAFRATTAAAVLAGCGPTAEPPQGSTIVQPYGAPPNPPPTPVPVPPPTSNTNQPPSPDEPGQVVALYGGPVLPPPSSTTPTPPPSSSAPHHPAPPAPSAPPGPGAPAAAYGGPPIEGPSGL